MIRNLEWCLCHYCRAEAPGALGWSPLGGKPVKTCEECWPERHHAWTHLFRRGDYHNEARDYAGARGGEFLEKLGKMDLGTLSEDEWREFLDILFRARESELRRLYSPGAP